MGLSQKSDKPLFLCFFFGSVSETVFKYSILREIKILLGQPLLFYAPDQPLTLVILSSTL
jgi:hypothetical protein